MELEMEDRFFGYEEPLDLVNFFRDGDIEGYCNTLSELIIKFDEEYSNLGISPIVENEKYGYLMLDYGFAIWALTKHIHNVALSSDEKDWKEVVQKVKDDFLKDDGSKLTQNGKLFVYLLSYFKLSFPNKDNSFYSKVLLESKKSKEWILLNSIAINTEPLKQLIGEHSFKQIMSIADSRKYNLLAFKRAVGNYVAEEFGNRGESLKMYSFWTKKTGLTRLLSN